MNLNDVITHLRALAKSSLDPQIRATYVQMADVVEEVRNSHAGSRRLVGCLNLNARGHSAIRSLGVETLGELVAAFTQIRRLQGIGEGTERNIAAELTLHGVEAPGYEGMYKDGEYVIPEDRR